ncbi:MAG: HAD family hydrolase [Terriglobales bacterium]
MLRGVIFDLDGVIIDSHPIHKAAWRRFLSSVGREVTDEELDFILDGRKKEDILRFFLGDLSDEQIHQYGHQKETLFREEALDINMVEGVTEFLELLQNAGIPMALATSGSHGRVHYILDRLRLKSCFRAVITGDDVVKGKPDPAIFLAAARHLDSPNADLLVIEDAVSGVKAAKEAHMKCLAIASNGRGQVLRKAGADLVVPNFVGLSVESLHKLGNGRNGHA